jgi:PAS domain S-box-containing protein
MTPTGSPPPLSGVAAIGAADPLDAAEWLAASPAALARVSADGVLAWANGAAAGLLGGLAAPAAGQPLAGLLGLHGADAARLQQALADAGTAEVQRQGADGRRGWLALAARPLRDGSRLLAISSLDALKAEAAEARRLAELLDVAGAMGRIGVWDRDLRSGQGHWDREVFRMRGLEGEGDAPSYEEAIRNVVPEDRPLLERTFSASTRQAGRYACRYRVVAPDGSLRLLHSQWLVKDGADGRPALAIGVVMDDTQSWQLARSHNETVSQLALAVDLAGIAIWRHDFANDRLHLNDQACSVLDIPLQPDGLDLQGVRDLIHPDDLAEARKAFDAAMSSGKAVDIELRYRRRDGSWRNMLTRRVLQTDADGRPLAMMGVALDVTDRIDESRRATELSRRFELATRAAGIGYWSLEDGQARARWSDQLRAIHGLAPGAPVPTLREWLDTHVHPEDRDDVRRRFKDWLKSGRRGMESDLRVVRSDGGVRHLISHSRVEGAEASPLLFGLVIDATERRGAEMALRQASERASLAARGAGLGAWETDLVAGTAFWDEQMWRLRGLVPQAEPLPHAERMELVHPDDREKLLVQMAGALDDDGPSSYEFRIMLPDGSIRWLASRSIGVRDEQGRLVRRIGVNWDVTDRRTADAVRHEREIALRESQAKSNFLARMSHELRTPLNAVLGFAQLLQAEDPGTDAAAASRQRRLAHIRAAGQHLLELINDVLDLSSLEAGEMRIALQPVVLAPLVAGTLPLLEPLLQERRVELVSGPLDGVVLGDATRLRQVLVNLLSNAIKYNREGGRVTLDTLQRDGVVVVRVADTGRGMTEQQLRHLFEPFNRLGIESEGIEGTGIGLAIVKALVERMGGSVHVQSTVGTGSVFELRLGDGASRPPAPPAARPHSRPMPLFDAGVPPRGTLLYVEDNPVNAQIISELIGRRADLRLYIAQDGLGGVKMATELQPDLVLLDMQLPDIDGHEVLRRLRAQSSTARIPVIALSANAMPEDIARALRAGMSDYWTKPLDFRAFMGSIDALFGPSPPR